jgi:hypothetical protein
MKIKLYRTNTGESDWRVVRRPTWLVVRLGLVRFEIHAR